MLSLVFLALLGASLAPASLANRDVIDKASIPPRNPTGGPVKIKLSLELQNLGSVDVEENALDVIAWYSYSWKDPRLAWADSRAAAKLNSSSVRVWADKIWTPDIMSFNALGKAEVISPNLAVVFSNGEIIYVPSVRERVSCNLRGLNTPQGATCTLKVGSWTYSSDDIVLADDAKINYDEFFAGSRYMIVSSNATKTSKQYPCCPETYESIDFSFTVKRNTRGGKNLESQVEAGVDEELNKKIERMVSEEMKEKMKKGTVVTKTKETKSFFIEG